MANTAAEAFRGWHDFYFLLGTAAATLIGAMFVVVSIGSRFMTEQRRPHINAFITSTVVHLSVVVLSCAIAMVPALQWHWLGVALSVGGIAGLLYGAAMGWRVLHGRVDWTDPVWYGLVPIVAYSLIVAVGASILVDGGPDLEALAFGPALLLVGGIRNSWDMIVFFALRDRGPE